jgi:ATP/maltotriose-dependent transcriptional regulator MalT
LGIPTAVSSFSQVITDILLAMMLPYTFHDERLAEIVPEAEITYEPASPAPKRTGEAHFIFDKIMRPEFGDLVERPRVTDFLRRSAAQFRGNLISGRAKTGKTYAAADLARGYRNVAWFTVDSTDLDWNVFARYLAAAVSPKTKVRDEHDIEGFLVDLFTAAAKRREETLIVIDDIHHVFDAPWFSEFFMLLLSSAVPKTHLLLLCRSKPPLPLWRLRSKQVLNVVDEKMLAFDLEETVEWCKKLGIPKQVSHLVPVNAYGRAGKVADFLRHASNTVLW